MQILEFAISKWGKIEIEIQAQNSAKQTLNSVVPCPKAMTNCGDTQTPKALGATASDCSPHGLCIGKILLTPCNFPQIFCISTFSNMLGILFFFWLHPHIFMHCPLRAHCFISQAFLWNLSENPPNPTTLAFYTHLKPAANWWCWGLQTRQLAEPFVQLDGDCRAFQVSGMAEHCKLNPRG